jgi:fumarate reductase flavoprotein subunit
MTENQTETIEAQVVVVGGGGAGLSAAVAAAEKGADVLLLEDLPKTGGNTQFAFGMFACESPVQARHGVVATRDEFFRSAMDYAQWTIDPGIIRAYINKTGDTIRWLEEKGVEFELPEKTRTYFGYTAPLCWHQPVPLAYAVTNALAQNFEELGGRIICRARGREILTGERGKVAGVLATRKGGGELRVKAKSVILATGGYGGNPELLSKYHDYYNENVLFTYPIKCQGDGLTMATRMGADTIGMGKICIEPKGFPGVKERELWILAIMPDSIWLDKKGKRFIDEATYIYRGAGGFQVVMQLYRMYHDYTNYTFIDQARLQHLLDIQGTPEASDHYRDLSRHSSTTSGLSMDELLEKEIKEGIVKKADTLEEMAEWMGIPADDLKETVEQYNASCDNRRDEMFVKDPEFLFPFRTPPYYAIKCTARFLNPEGGIKISPKMEALDYSGDPVPGIYATGIDTGGWEGDSSYNIILNGSFFGFAINSGRIAGENAADFVQGK